MAKLDRPVIGRSRKPDLAVIGRPQVREALAPFDEHQGLFVQQVFDPDGLDLGCGLQAVQVDVIDGGWVAVLMDEGEGGAGYFRGGTTGSFRSDPFDQSGFAGSQVADEQDQTFAGEETG